VLHGIVLLVPGIMGPSASGFGACPGRKPALEPNRNEAAKPWAKTGLVLWMLAHPALYFLLIRLSPPGRVLRLAPGLRASVAPGADSLFRAQLGFLSAASPPTARVKEPISIIGTCATEAMWDAVLGGSRRRIYSMLEATDNEMRPERSLRDRGAYPCQMGAQRRKPLLSAPSLRVAARTGVCVVARLDPIDIGLHRAPRIHPVLVTTHHAPIIEIGSSDDAPRSRALLPRLFLRRGHHAEADRPRAGQARPRLCLERVSRGQGVLAAAWLPVGLVGWLSPPVVGSIVLALSVLAP